MIIWISNNLNGIIVGIISSGVITAIAWAGTKCFGYLKIRKSEYTGKWDQFVYSQGDDMYQGEVIKRDQYEIKHIKMRYTGNLVTNIHGTIQRVIPLDQTHRHWDCIGYLDGEILTILYQSMEGQKSRGCIYLRLFNDFEFRGYYLEEHRDGTIDKTPVIIKKAAKTP